MTDKNRMSREEYLKRCEEVEDTACTQRKDIPKHLVTTYFYKT